jgi:hypothetical protein
MAVAGKAFFSGGSPFCSVLEKAGAGSPRLLERKTRFATRETMN